MNDKNMREAIHNARCELYQEIAGHLEAVLHGYDDIERNECKKMIAKYYKLSAKPFQHNH